MSRGVSPHQKTNWKPQQHAHVPWLHLISKEVDELTHAERNVWMVLYGLLRKKGNIWQGYQSYNQLAAAARCNRATAIRAMGKCLKLGLVAKRHRFRDFGDQAANLWRILPPPDLRSPEEQEAIGALLEAWQHPQGPEKPERFQASLHRQEAAQRPVPEKCEALDLVRSFHRKMYGRVVGDRYRPFPAELALAEQILELPNPEDALKWAYKRIGEWKPQTFCGLDRYIREYQDLQHRYELARRAADEEAQRQEQLAMERLAAAQASAERELRLQELAREEERRRLRLEEEAKRQKEELEIAAAAEAARGALADLPGLMGRLVVAEAQFAALHPPEIGRDGKALDGRLVARERMARIFLQDELVALQRRCAHIEKAERGDLVAPLEVDLELFEAQIRLRMP